MFCPKCGLQANSDVKFCKQCGANLRSVQEALVRGGAPTGATKDFDWSKTWVAEMFLSEEERERRQGITPEIKRLNEIKGGVITSFVGLGAMIFLYFLLGAVAANEPARDAMIISKVWLVGLVPFLVGLGLIFNGLFVSKRIVELKKQQQAFGPVPQPLSTPTTSPLGDVPQQQVLPPYSVTDQTTVLLEKPPQAAVPATTERN